ncbi:MAG: gamma-glutamylcyclotransferase [Phycisphaerae bacterium]|nr:gamma-glutamylcyclotransferase [Phycisphaerae bacterium]
MKECRNNLFTYGTLMCDDIMQHVSGCAPACVPGTLTGYSRRSVTGESYPAILQHRPGRVKGLVYLNVPDWAWQRLDRFEGEMYARQSVQIGLQDGSTVPAATYVIKPEFLRHLDPSDWDFTEFLTSHKDGFQKQCLG